MRRKALFPRLVTGVLYFDLRIETRTRALRDFDVTFLTRAVIVKRAPGASADFGGLLTELTLSFELNTAACADAVSGLACAAAGASSAPPTAATVTSWRAGAINEPTS